MISFPAFAVDDADVIINTREEIRQKLMVIIPPANFVCGGVYCFHVVRACVCVCVRACVRPCVRPSVRNVLFP